MFDANLRGAPELEPVMVRFHGAANRNGDTTNIIAGDYECQLNPDKSITIHNPRFRNSKAKESVNISCGDTGYRFVTFEGFVT